MEPDVDELDMLLDTEFDSFDVDAMVLYTVQLVEAPAIEEAL